MEPLIDQLKEAERRYAELEDSDRASVMQAAWQEIERLHGENQRWKSTYNDLVGRIPGYMLDKINRGEVPHRHELPNPWKDRAAELDAEIEALRNSF